MPFIGREAFLLGGKSFSFSGQIMLAKGLFLLVLLAMSAKGIYNYWDATTFNPVQLIGTNSTAAERPKTATATTKSKLAGMTTKKEAEITTQIARTSPWQWFKKAKIRTTTSSLRKMSRLKPARHEKAPTRRKMKPFSCCPFIEKQIFSKQL